MGGRFACHTNLSRHVAHLLNAVGLPEPVTYSLEAQKLWRPSSRAIRHFL
jgi:hypothetical protein